MKIVKPLLIAGVISMMLPSCFLFQSKHQSCPAYGQQHLKKDKKIDIRIADEKEISQKA